MLNPKLLFTPTFFSLKKKNTESRSLWVVLCLQEKENIDFCVLSLLHSSFSSSVFLLLLIFLSHPTCVQGNLFFFPPVHHVTKYSRRKTITIFSSLVFPTHLCEKLFSCRTHFFLPLYVYLYARTDVFIYKYKIMVWIISASEFSFCW